jgi:hypothetical protein
MVRSDHKGAAPVAAQVPTAFTGFAVPVGSIAILAFFGSAESAVASLGTRNLAVFTMLGAGHLAVAGAGTAFLPSLADARYAIDRFLVHLVPPF